MKGLPRSCSSAGVPKTRIVPGSFFSTRSRFAATAAATAAVPSRLWPHPWPGAPAASGVFFGAPAACESPGSASYSARIPTTGGPLPAEATKAVGMPATPRVTRNPSFSRTSARSADDFVSWRAVSENPQIFPETSFQRADADWSQRSDAAASGGEAAVPGAGTARRARPRRAPGRGKGTCIGPPERGMCRLRETAYDGRMTKRVRALALLTLAALLVAPPARPQSGGPGDDQKTKLEAPGVSIPIDVREQYLGRTGDKTAVKFVLSVSKGDLRGAGNVQPRVYSFFLSGDVTNDRGQAVESFRVPVDIDLSSTDVTNASKPVAISFLRAL